jgi:hypothetical protein
MATVIVVPGVKSRIREGFISFMRKRVDFKVSPRVTIRALPSEISTIYGTSQRTGPRCVRHVSVDKFAMATDPRVICAELLFVRKTIGIGIGIARANSNGGEDEDYGIDHSTSLPKPQSIQDTCCLHLYISVTERGVAGKKRACRVSVRRVIPLAPVNGTCP